MKLISCFSLEIKKSFVKRGISGTIYFGIAKILENITNLLPSQRRKLIRQRKADLEFDKRYGVDTSGILRISDMTVNSQNSIYGVRYQAIGFIDFHQILESFELRYEHFYFIDFGSGKGRAILLASFLPFKKIIGVEFSEELTTISKDNLRRFPDEEKKCMDIDLVCEDAADFDIPNEPSVLYFYNPFDKPVMERVANNLVASFKRHPRRIVVIYLKPEHADVWDNIPVLNKKVMTNRLCIYDSQI